MPAAGKCAEAGSVSLDRLGTAFPED